MNPVVYITLLMLIAFALGVLLTLLCQRESKQPKPTIIEPTVLDNRATQSPALLSEDHLQRGHDPLDLAHAYHEMTDHEQTQDVLYELLRVDDRSVQWEAAQKLVAWYKK